MPALVQRMLLAIRTLLEDESDSSRKKRSTNNVSGLNDRSRQTVALVLTFRDLFASGNLNLVMENIAETKGKHHTKERNSNISKSRKKCIGEPIAASSPILIRSSEMPSRIVGLATSTPTVWPLVLEGTDDTVPLLREERIISSSLISFQNIDHELGQTLVNLETRQLNSYSKINRNIKREHLTVSLYPDDEKQTATVLRKIHKWSPRKRRAVSFTLPVTRKEEQKAVAVVQNAVNRVKEENFNKKKRKWKFLKLC